MIGINEFFHYFDYIDIQVTVRWLFVACKFISTRANWHNNNYSLFIHLIENNIKEMLFLKLMKLFFILSV